MPSTVRIIKAHDFIKATAEGELDLERSKKLLLEVASASAPLVDYEIILDTRKMQSEMTMTDLWYLAKELANLRSAFSRKTAVLCSVERFDYAGFFALCAENRGLQVRAFSSFEDAIEWLVGDKESNLSV